MKSFDIIIPLGSSCFTSTALRERNIQLESYPFDWIKTVTLKDAIDFMETHFDNFLNIDDLAEGDRIPLNSHKTCINKKNGIYFLHDFPFGPPLSESFPEQMEKYNRRINRLYKRINTYNKILFLHVYIGSEKFDDNYIQEQFLRLKNLYPGKKISLIFATLSEKENSKGYVCKNISPLIRTYTCFSDGTINKAGEYWQEYKKSIQKVLSEYKLNKKLKSRIRRERSSWKDSVIFIIKKIKRFPLNLISCLIPSKRLRHKLKGKKFLKIKKDVDLN